MRIVIRISTNRPIEWLVTSDTFLSLKMSLEFVHNVSSYQHISYTMVMKKRSEATQTLRAGCSMADPQTNKQTGAITIH